MNKEKIGRGILYTIAVFTTFGGFVIDLNYTHLFNPRWTPPAITTRSPSLWLCAPV